MVAKEDSESFVISVLNNNRIYGYFKVSKLSFCLSFYVPVRLFSLEYTCIFIINLKGKQSTSKLHYFLNFLKDLL